MRGIFISYRREDAEGQAGRLFDDLANEFGNAAVFMDVAGIEPGRDFRRAIDENVANCGVLLAIIGKNWLNIRDAEGQRRIDDPMDFVRLETAAALKRDIPVIPVLVQGANMPRTAHLPPDLVDIAFRNGVELTHARWDSDVQILFKALRPHVQLAGAAGLNATPPVTIGEAVRAAGTSQPLNSKTIGVIAATLVAVALVIGGYAWHSRKSGTHELAEVRATANRAEEARNLGTEQQAAALSAEQTAKHEAERALASENARRLREAKQTAAAELVVKQAAAQHAADTLAAAKRDLEVKETATEIVEKRIVDPNGVAMLAAEKRDREAKQQATIALARKQAAAEFARKRAAELEKTLAAETRARQQAEQALAQKAAAAAQVQKQADELARMKDAEALAQTKAAEELARKEAAEELARENAAQEIKNKPAESAWPLPYSH